MKIYYHVSTILASEETFHLEEGGKPLQDWVDFFKDLNCDSYESFLVQYNIIIEKYPHIECETQRRLSKWMAEALFEIVRKKKYPSCPSRMDGVFLFEDYEKANEFNSRFRKGKGSIFACELEHVKSFNMSYFTEVEEDMNCCLNKQNVTEEKYKHWIIAITEYWNNDQYQSNDAEYIYQGSIYLTRINQNNHFSRTD